MDVIRSMIRLLVGSFGFCAVAIWIKELVQLCTAMLLAPKFGFKVNRFSIFHIVFTKQDGVWVRSKGARSPLIQTLITVDLSKPHVPGETEKKEKLLEALRVLILLLFSAGIFALCFPSVMTVFKDCQSLLDCRLSGVSAETLLPVVLADMSILDCFLAGFSVGMCWHSLVTMAIRLYVYGVMMKKLPGYVQTLTNRLRAGERFSAMGLRPLEELPYKNPTQMEKMFYYSFYLSAMLDQGNIGALQKPTQEMTSYFRNREYIMQETWNYYWLVFYYSRFELNPPAATHFLNKIREAIDQDKDANAKRVLAYYAFGIEQDFPKARNLWSESYAALEKCSCVGERELERKLLSDLDGFLRAKGY